MEIKKYISRIKVIKATIYFQKKFKKSLDTGEIPCYTLISYAGNSMIFVAVDRRQPKKPFYMLEYNPHTERIVQCRGYDNKGGRDSDPQIARFCEQWLSFIKERKQIRVKIAV